MAFKPKRGDVVAYGSYLYFFQPEGNYARLYHHSEEVGILSKAAITPHREHIQKPDDEKARNFIAQDKARREMIPRKPASHHIWSSSDSDEDSSEDHAYSSPLKADPLTVYVIVGKNPWHTTWSKIGKGFRNKEDAEDAKPESTFDMVYEVVEIEIDAI
jgi:hypothetical protein